MNVIICLDDKNGIQFNQRRQSKDRVVCERILEITQGAPLRMNAYSAKMFPSDRITVEDDFLKRAAEGDYCFVESSDFLQYVSRLEKIIVYRWNRVYPSDIVVDKDFFARLKRIGSTDFAGCSHERITEEVYR